MDTPGGSYTPPSPPTSGGTPSAEELIRPKQPPEDPTKILLLNLIGGCVGYFILGQKNKGIVAVIAFVLGLIFTCGILSGLVAIAAAIDGMMQAQQLQAGHPVGQWTFFQDHR
jgi:hypothetical protein